MSKKILQYTHQLLKIQLALLLIIFFIRIFEVYYFNSKLILPGDFLKYEARGLFYDLLFWSTYSVIIWLLLLPFYKIMKWHSFFAKFLGTTILISSLSLLVFFVERGAPLDKELIVNSLTKNITTIQNSEKVSFGIILTVLGTLSLFFVANIRLKRMELTSRSVYIIAGVSIILSIINIASTPSFAGYTYSVNKINFLGKSIATHFLYDQKFNIKNNQAFVVNRKMKNDILLYQKQNQGDFVSEEYPILKQRNLSNPLSSYFSLKDEKPNIVFVVVESLSRDFCGEDAELGNFLTPFVDSLSKNSLYWENCLSSSAISFEVLPTLLGSLPYGHHGFNMLPQYPNHLSLIQILRANNYRTSFITGAPMYFDNQGAFMRHQGVDFLSYTFPEKYVEMDNSKSWNWGYPDDVIFNYGLERLDSATETPYLDVYVTITTHPPYNFNEKEHYAMLFEKRLASLNQPEAKKKDLRKMRELFSSFIYFDHSLQKFFDQYQKRDDFSNTIFIITGDHHGYFAPKNVLGKFHVPLIIYSPLMKTSKKFSSIVTHHDIVPSILNLITNKYALKMPTTEHWLGQPLDTSSLFQTKQSISLVNWNKSIDYYLDGEYFLAEKSLFKIVDKNLNIEQIKDDSIQSLLNTKLNIFKSVNTICCYNNAIMPDSLVYKSNTYSTLVSDYIFEEEISSSRSFPATHTAMLSPSQADFRVQIEFDILLPEKHFDSLPNIVVSVKEQGAEERKYYDAKNLQYLNNGEITHGKWVKMTLNDHINLSKLVTRNNLELTAYIHNPHHCNIKLNNFILRIYTK